MEPEERVVGEEAGESPPQPPPDRKKWAIAAFIATIIVVTAAVSLPDLLVRPPEGESRPVSAPVTETTLVPPPHKTPGVTIPAPPEATPSPSAGGPPEFTVTVSPTAATAGRGETVTYHMRIEAQNGFSDPIHMELSAGFLFFSQTYDLGTQEPPYPKSFEYPFTVPDSLPSGVVVNGVIRSTGGGITRENQLTLTVR